MSPHERAYRQVLLARCGSLADVPCSPSGDEYLLQLKRYIQEWVCEVDAELARRISAQDDARLALETLEVMS